MVGIIRPLSSEELQDSVQIGSENILDKFLKVLSKKQSEYQKSKRPFDSYSARIDFESYVRNKTNELANIVDPEIVDKSIDFGNLDKYGKLSRFEFLEAIPVQVNRLVAGIKQEVVIGKRYKFKCVQRGNHISIVVENEELEDFEKWFNSVFLKKDKNKTVNNEDEKDKDKNKE